MDKKPALAVIVPALNEEGSLQDTIRSAYQAMGQKFEAHEILIFNDWKGL